MSLILGALAGGAKAVDEIATGQINDRRESDRAQMMADIQLERAKAIEEFKMQKGEEQANRLRTEQAGRIDEASKGLIGQMQTDKLNRFYGDGSNLTDADISDEERAAVPISERERNDARTRAAIQTGDISPEKAALLTQKGEKYTKVGANETILDENGKVVFENTRGMDLEEAKILSREMIADKRFATMLEAADRRAAKAGGDGKPPAIVATAEWLRAKGIAKTDEEAWKMANQLKEKTGEEIKSDSYGNINILDRDSGEISRIDSEGNRTVLRAAKSGKAANAPASKPWEKYKK